MLLGLIKSVILKKNDTANSTEEGRPWHSSRARDSTECHIPFGALFTSPAKRRHCTCVVVAHTRTCCGTAPLSRQDSEQNRVLGFAF